MTNKSNKESEEKLNVFQALNSLKVTGRLRGIFEKKFNENKKTETEWKKVFKSKGFDF